MNIPVFTILIPVTTALLLAGTITSLSHPCRCRRSIGHGRRRLAALRALACGVMLR